MPIRQFLILLALFATGLGIVGIAWASGTELFLYLDADQKTLQIMRRISAGLQGVVQVVHNLNGLEIDRVNVCFSAISLLAVAQSLEKRIAFWRISFHETGMMISQSYSRAIPRQHTTRTIRRARRAIRKFPNPAVFYCATRSCSDAFHVA
jgi:hypothetical protein